MNLKGWREIWQQTVSRLLRASNANSNDSVLSILTAPPELLITYNATRHIDIPSGFGNTTRSSSSSDDSSDHSDPSPADTTKR